MRELDPKALEAAGEVYLSEQVEMQVPGQLDWATSELSSAIHAYLDAADLVERVQMDNAVSKARMSAIEQRDEARKEAEELKESMKVLEYHFDRQAAEAETRGRQLAALWGALEKIAAETLPRKRFRSFTVMNRGACADIARAALTDTAAAAAQYQRVEWKAIEEYQPPSHETILFLCSNGDIYQGRPCYGIHAPWWCGHGKLNGGKVLKDEGLIVTHWIPKLDAPKAGEPEDES